MSHDSEYDMIDKVRKALGRIPPLAEAPVPPALPEPIVRLVHTDIGLPELFARRADEMKMLVEFVHPEDIAVQLVAFLKERGVKRVALAVSKLFEQLQVYEAIRDAGIDSARWDQISLDQMYDYDCAVTDVTYAVAETGTLVIRTHAGNGRALSLTPMIHVAIVEPSQYVPDLLDVFEKLATDHRGRHVVMISGPSKTADIEMNVVTGVHGPNVVKVLLFK